MSEPLDDYALAALRDLIDEKAERGGTISAKNAQRLLATLDAARSHPDQLEVTLDEARLAEVLRRMTRETGPNGEEQWGWWSTRDGRSPSETFAAAIARRYAALADTQEESHD